MVDLLKVFQAAKKTDVKTLFEAIGELTTNAVRNLEALVEYTTEKVVQTLIKKADL